MSTRVTMNSSDDDIETALVAGRAMLVALRAIAAKTARPDKPLRSALQAQHTIDALKAIEHGEKAGLF